MLIVKTTMVSETQKMYIFAKNPVQSINNLINITNLMHQARNILNE